MIGRSATVILGALLVGFGPLTIRADDGGGGLKAGDTLGSDNWQLARRPTDPQSLRCAGAGALRQVSFGNRQHVPHTLEHAVAEKESRKHERSKTRNSYSISCFRYFRGFVISG